MGLLTKAIGGTKSHDHNRIVKGPGFELGHSITSTYKHYTENELNNGYSSIRAIASRFKAIEPFTINANGKPVDSKVIDAIYRPNQQMSAVRFREALAIMALVHNKTTILVWRREGKEAYPGGEITADNIAGFTFLEHCTKIKHGGSWVYQVQDDNGGTRYFTKDEVITITSGVNPYNVSGGYSPSKAAKKWTRLDDYIADYETGFFENGAIPAGQFVIQAPTGREYKDIVENLQDKHRGSGNNNNVSYAYDPIDPATGKGAGPTITWIPFSQTNNDLDLKTIFEQVNQKIDSAFGVPATIRGVNEAVTYASAQVDERNFVVNNIQPFALDIWSQFTHELNRITKGLGVAITFDLEIPAVADEDKVIAARKKIESDLIAVMMDRGHSLDSIVDAFELSVGYKKLSIGYTPPVIENDKPQVDEGNEVEESPDEEEVVTKKEVSKGTNPKALSHLLSTHKTITASKRDTYQNKLKKVAKKYMKQQIEAVPIDTKLIGDANISLLEGMTDDMLAVITLIQEDAGKEQYKTGVRLVLESGIDIPKNDTFKLSQNNKMEYRRYLSNIVQDYTKDTSESIRTILARGQEQEWTRAEIEKNLANIINTDDYRAERIAISEVNRSSSVASVNAMEQIQEESEIQFETSMESTTGDPCPFCEVRIGVWYPTGEVMVEKGATITGSNGEQFVNNWDSNYGHDIHANGKCVPVYRVVGRTKAVKMVSATKEIHCKECNRYLGEATGSVNAVIKCSNSKCKLDNAVQIDTV